MPRDIGSIIDNKYNNLSLGDKVIANTITNKKPTRDIGSIIDDYITKDASEIVGTSNIIPVDRNEDNSVKVTFDNIYENNKLAEVAKDFYYFRDQEKFESNKDAIDYYINDRTWKQANVVSIGREYSYITGEDIKKDQLQRYAYLTKTWGDLPNMFQEGGGTAGQRFFRLGKNIFYAIADPINIVGVGIGGAVAKGAVKTAADKALKVAIAKAIKGKTKAAAKKITDKMTSAAIGKALIGEEAVKLAEKEGFKAGTKGIATTASIDSLALGGADVARQYTEMEVNPEQKYDPLRTGTVAIAVLGLSGTAQFVLAGAGTLFKQGFISKSAFPEEKIGVKAGTNKLTKVKKSDPLKPKEGPTGFVSQSKFQNTLTFLKTNMFDAYDPIVSLQRDMTGIGGSVKEVRKAHKKEKNPFLKKKIEQRIAMLSGSVGIIRVGANSKIELKEKKYRVEDAIYATRAALKEGIVPGGGIALLNASQFITPDNVGETILLNAIKAPFETILHNAGIEDYNKMDEGVGIDVITGKKECMLKLGIIDPLLVTKTALKNAVSVVSTIVSANCVISNIRINEGS